MALNLTDTQLDQIAETLFICKPVTVTSLPKPANSTGALSLAAKLDPIGADSRFAHLGIGVVDFTNLAAPKVWMHNAAAPWRIASTAKLALMLATVQLRDDVRWLFRQGFITTAQDGDDLFKMPSLWRRSSNPVTALLADTKRPPRISTIFDFPAGGLPELRGPDTTLPATSVAVITRLRQDFANPAKTPHLKWSYAKKYKFSERLWMAGALSDNTAATTCISEIGVPYLKAVQSAYGVWDVPNDMDMLLADGYEAVDTSAPVDAATPRITYRSIARKDVAHVHVLDGLRDASGQFADRDSSESGNVFALIAYMLAWRQNTLISSEACNIITSCLADDQDFTMGSRIVDGVPDGKVRKQSTKIGLLDKADGERTSLNCEFAYVETAPTFVTVLNYGAVVTGLRPGTTGLIAADIGTKLGSAIFNALKP